MDHDYEPLTTVSKCSISTVLDPSKIPEDIKISGEKDAMADALADLLKGVKDSPQQGEQPPTSRSILPMNRDPIQKP